MRTRQTQKHQAIHRFAELTLTAFFWILWLYLIMPLLSLLMWYAGYELFVDAMIVRGGYETLIVELRHYGLVILGILLAMLAWVQWNLHHYGTHNHRTHLPVPVQVAETAAHAGLSIDELNQLRIERAPVVAFDPNDQLRLQTRPE